MSVKRTVGEDSVEVLRRTRARHELLEGNPHDGVGIPREPHVIVALPARSTGPRGPTPQ